ncbi:hypothetical protein DZF91_05275 [Actinomadura logoneensis]|uniref:Uncharacterized protein n=1 Tax=Actinomadura logoneensis TaxID=2293572 RepID=A0A372JRW4_9ACTN|nr:hypothetical protein [Actinomadura logoneensis]RFU42689.1 hypothetical protein DZF91_05275 [Actinomadura logoneensis]
MRIVPGRSNGRWLSPAVPTIATCVLAALWGFSAFGGWSDEAFCGEASAHDADCGDAVLRYVWLSVPAAFVGLGIGVMSWLLPGVRRRPGLLARNLSIAVCFWVLAETIMFVGGFLAKH